MTNDDEKFDLLSFRKIFIDEAFSIIDDAEDILLDLMLDPVQNDKVNAIFRCFHSLKGSGASVGLVDVAKFTHKAEDCLQIFRSATEQFTQEHVSLFLKVIDSIRGRLQTALEFSEDPEWNTFALEQELDKIFEHHSRASLLKSKADGFAIFQEIKQKNEGHQLGFGIFDESNTEDNSSKVSSIDKPDSKNSLNQSSLTKSFQNTHVFKVSADKIDAVLESLGELVVIKNQLLQGVFEIPDIDSRIGSLINQLDKDVRDLHERTLSMRLVPLNQTFKKLKRTILETAKTLGKEVQIEIKGEDTEIDRIVAEEISDPLMHICRNSVDHGIESPESRSKSGKSPKGTIALTAFQDGSHIVIQISDDGGGVDDSKVIKKAIDQGLIHQNEAEKVTKDRIYELLLSPGFSTSDSITDISGRGVGMDVVKNNIQKLNGTIIMDSEKNHGTMVTLKLPLSTTITEGIHVQIQNEQYIIPIQYIRSFGEFEEMNVITDSESEFIKFQNQHYPFVRLAKLLNLKKDSESNSRVLILAESRNQRFVINVDRVFGKIQVVLKPIDLSTKDHVMYHGAAVLGDGRVAVVLDLNHIKEVLRRKTA